MTAYVIAHVDIADRDGFRDYEKQFHDALEPHGGRLLAAEDQVEPLEGPWPDGRTVVLAFDDEESARAWYHSERYQEISEIRRAHSTGSIALLRGRPPRS